MLIWIRAHALIFALTIAGSVVGVFSGIWLGHVMLVRAAQASLSAYAQELKLNVDDMGDEINATLRAARSRTVRACSNQDLAELQAETFRSVRVKDIGRTHEGKLYCSAFLGRLAYPYIEGTPSIVLQGGVNIYTNVAVVLASQDEGHGTVIEAGDVDVVLNSNAFGNRSRSHLNYMVVAFNRETGKMTLIAGAPLAIDPALTVAQGSQIVRGSIYKSICSTKHPLCIVTTERLSDVWASTRSTQFAYSAMGGFAGLSLGLLIALFCRRTNSLSYQLVQALRKNSPSLCLVYQPIQDVVSGRCVGTEALLRWTDQNGVSVPPDAFVSVAEQSGFVHELTAFVVRRATREMFDLLIRDEDFTLSINIAASDLGDERFFELLRENVSLAGIRARQIVLELTERSTADLTLVRAAIQRLCAEGYKVHIDDFGIGFSSLSYIDQLRVNAIKIDRAFTRTIGTDAVIAPILSQMLEMAHALGVEVVVEGVETEIQRDYLAASGMPLNAQGWYFSKPLTAEALQLFTAQNKTMQSSALRAEQQTAAV